MASHDGRTPSWDLVSRPKKKQQDDIGEWQVVGEPKMPAGGSQGTRPLPQRNRPTDASKRQQNQPTGRTPASQYRTRASPDKSYRRRGGTDSTRQRRAPPKLNSDCDNEAEQGWRQHEEALDNIRIPSNIALHDKTWETIARNNGTFIQIIDFRDLNASGSATFGIWGDTRSVAVTKNAIRQWLEDGMTSKNAQGKSQFAQLRSMTPQQSRNQEKLWRAEVNKHKFRQHPLPSMEFEAMGSFHWPVEEYRPDDVFGPNYEALDPIRVDCSCYITFNRDRDMFKVMGKKDKVQEALNRIRKSRFQIEVRQLRPLRSYLLHWPDATNIPSHINLQAYFLPKVLGGRGDGVKGGYSPRGDGVVDGLQVELQAELQSKSNEEHVQKQWLKLLRALRYFRGNIEPRIRFATFLAQDFKRAEDKAGLYGLDEFKNMIVQSQFRGRVAQEIGDRAIEEGILRNLQESDGVIIPQDPTITNLSEVQPVYSVVFTFEDQAGDLRLTVVWRPMQDSDAKEEAFEGTSKRWTRLERTIEDASAKPIVEQYDPKAGMSSLLDMSLTDLNTGMAWQFDINAAQAVDKSHLPNQYVDFEHSIKIDHEAVGKQSTDKLFVFCRPFGIRIKSIQQCISYRYDLSGTKDYTLELTRFQNRVFPARKADAPSFSAVAPVVFEPRWSLSVYRVQWDQLFLKNEQLAIGKMADWDDGVETWFPEDVKPGDQPRAGAGFAQLMENLKRVAKLVLEAGEEEDLVGGMKVG